MTFNDGNIFKKENINLNTIVALVGFLSMFAAFITTWTSLQYKQSEIQKWEEDHIAEHNKWQELSTARNVAVNTRLDSMQLILNKQDQIDYRLAQAEKGQINTDERIGRVSESYGIQFTEIRTQLAIVTTQLALANETLKRLEAIDVHSIPKELQQ